MRRLRLLVILKAIKMLSSSTHRRHLSHFPALQFCLCHFPSVEMKGHIAIWNPYVKVIIILSIFTAGVIWGGNVLRDQGESPRGSVVFPHPKVEDKADSNLSGLAEGQHFPEARSPSGLWSSDFFQAGNRETRRRARLVFAAGCSAHPCPGGPAVCAPCKRLADDGVAVWKESGFVS